MSTEFIDLTRTINGDTTTASLAVPKHPYDPVEVVGGLPHCCFIRPRDGHHARRLAAWAIWQAERHEIVRQLEDRFPWLGTDDEANGADAVDAINAWYLELKAD